MSVAVDTNIIVRFLVRDDEAQAAKVYQRLKQAEAQNEKFKIPLLVLLETLWVLESAYDRSREKILHSISELKQVSVFDFEAETAVERMLREGANAKADLSDVLIAHVARELGCESGLTFDKDAAKLPFFQLLT